MWLGNAMTSSTCLQTPDLTKPKMYSTSKEVGFAEFIELVYKSTVCFGTIQHQLHHTKPTKKL